mmetsp:Transcript_15451/g.38933  ORF Transcript_15451/g.38933 Transcript_15451/m.38933 type:complete len:203 (+) Transcript_15451:1127-1735(+)
MFPRRSIVADLFLCDRQCNLLVLCGQNKLGNNFVDKRLDSDGIQFQSKLSRFDLVVVQKVVEDIGGRLSADVDIATEAQPRLSFVNGDHGTLASITARGSEFCLNLFLHQVQAHADRVEWGSHFVAHITHEVTLGLEQLVLGIELSSHQEIVCHKHQYSEDHDADSTNSGVSRVLRCVHINKSVTWVDGNGVRNRLGCEILR